MNLNNSPYSYSPGGGPVIPDLSPLEPPASSPTPRSDTQNSDEWIMGPWPSPAPGSHHADNLRPSRDHSRPASRPGQGHSYGGSYGGSSGGYNYPSAPYPAVAPYATPMMHPMAMHSPGGAFHGPTGPYSGGGGGYPGMASPYLHPTTPYMGHAPHQSPQMTPGSPYTYQMAPPGSPFMGGGGPAMASMGGMAMGAMGMGGIPGGFPGMMGGGGMMPPQAVPMTMARPPSPLNRPKVEEWSINPWLAGKDYGPVLDPRTLTILGAPPLRLHPLLQPFDSSDTSSTKAPHLVFNILFPPNAIYLSTESSAKSWSAGRDEPATLPRVTQVRIICNHTPWLIEAKNLNTGVTCGDIAEKICASFSKDIHKSEWAALPPTAKAEVTMTWKHNRSTAPGAPGGVMGQPVKRVDFLGDRTMFAGLVRDEKFVLDRLGGMGDKDMATFVLQLDSR